MGNEIFAFPKAVNETNDTYKSLAIYSPREVMSHGTED